MKARLFVTAVAAALNVFASAGASARGEGSWTKSLQPDAAFIQYGGGTRTSTLTAGLQWQPSWRMPLLGGSLSTYIEASLGRWALDGEPRASAWVTQIGLTPVLRWRPGAEDGRWFAEAGIGVNLVAPVYRSENRQFSTTFNFGDHLGLGRNFGAKREHELALRYEHFSNAGISHPNPGMNFVQLRYTYAF